MPEWIAETQEYVNWGLNPPTIGFLGIILFTFIEGWGLIAQNRSIWDPRSGESVSVILFSFLLFFMFAFGLYGLYTKSIAIAFNGFALGIIHVPIIIGLWKFKRFSTMEKWWVLLTAMMVPAMIVLPWKDAVYLILAFTTLFAAVAQPWEIWKNKRAGVVDIRLLVVYLLSTAFWMTYAFSTGQLPLEITTSATLIILVATIALWHRYKSVGCAQKRS